LPDRNRLLECQTRLEGILCLVSNAIPGTAKVTVTSSVIGLVAVERAEVESIVRTDVRTDAREVRVIEAVVQA